MIMVIKIVRLLLFYVTANCIDIMLKFIFINYIYLLLPNNSERKLRKSRLDSRIDSNLLPFSTTNRGFKRIKFLF